MRLIPLYSRRLGISAGRPDLFRSFQHEFDDVLWCRNTTFYVDNAVIGQHGPCGFYFFMARHGDLPIDRRTIAYFHSKKAATKSSLKKGAAG